jgi:hypothetical protein
MGVLRGWNFLKEGGETGKDRDSGSSLSLEEMILLTVGAYGWIPELGRFTGAEGFS